MSQRHRKPGRGPLVASLLLHVSIFAAFWASTLLRPDPVLYETYAIELYSPPPSVEAAEPDLQPPVDELVVETPVEQPEPTPPPPVPDDPDPEPEPEPVVEDRPAAPPPDPTPTEEPREERPSSGPDADPNSPGGEDINIQMEGLRRDYPEYYANIQLQIKRCFRPPREGAWVTTVDFRINRDGSIGEPDYARRSGNLVFDNLALSAVECAGTRFGPLPGDMPVQQLPIRFTFTPAGGGGS